MLESCEHPESLAGASSCLGFGQLQNCWHNLKAHLNSIPAQHSAKCKIVLRISSLPRLSPSCDYCYPVGVPAHG